MAKLLGKTPANICHAQSMEEAIAFAYKYTPGGKICLLSTACPYGLWKNFEEKGKVFAEEAKKQSNLHQLASFYPTYFQKMNPDSVNIHPSWKEQLKAEFSSPYFQQIKDFLLSEHQKGFITFPLGKDIFRAFDLTPFDQVKVVILGQDPYHGV